MTTRVPDSPTAVAVSSLDELRKLAALRDRLRAALADVAPTLLWFAKQQALGGMPANIWKKLDRLPSPRMAGLSPAFDLTHSLQRLARCLRQFDEQSEKAVVKGLEKLTARLETECNLSGKTEEKRHRVLMKLLSDDRTGTMSIQSAARVLRCGSFPIRIPALPSYVAGHVVFSELRLIRQQFEQFGMSGTIKRAPSAAFLAQGAAAMGSFISMVRSRANICDAIGRDIEQILTLSDIVGVHAAAMPFEDQPHLWLAHRAQVVFLLTRLAGNLRTAGVSMLGFRESLFVNAADGVDEQIDEAKKLVLSWAAPRGKTETNRGTLEDWAKQLPTALVGLFNANVVATTQSAHEQGYTASHACIVAYNKNLKAITNALHQPQEHRASRSLSKLERRHELGERNSGAGALWSPSLSHTARVRLLNDYWNKDSREHTLELFDFLVANGGEAPASGAHSRATASETPQSRLLTALTASWDLHAEAFRNAPAPGADGDSWIDKRQKVFAVAETLARQLNGSRRLADVVAAFRKASGKYHGHASAIQGWLTRETGWASHFAERLLFGSLIGSTDRSDPLDLLSALWICDHAGTPLPESLEERTAVALAALQRPDGSFETGRPPVKWMHGFVTQAPSAATISVLASYLAERDGDAAPGLLDTASYGRRLMRWEPICLRGVDFLLDSRVGRYHEGRELSGWHSDRNPEDDRIDLFTTCVAVRALCEMDELLSKFINRRAFEGLQVQHPPRGKAEEHFVYDCLSISPERDEVPVLSSAQRASEWLRYHTKGFPWPRPLSPAEYQPRTTLYYGPPGTGKTHASDLIAGELGWPLVTVNPHHFLREGDAFVAKVAADICERLRFASNCCVIFDEFDQMIVDRNLQDMPSPLGMLTATMLPLLHDLNDHAGKNSCLVAFATNYHAFLDAAAIRHGRIDQQSCVVYPDYGSRYLCILVAATTALAEAKERIAGELKKLQPDGSVPSCASGSVLQDLASSVRELLITLRKFAKSAGRTPAPTKAILQVRADKVCTALRGPLGTAPTETELRKLAQAVHLLAAEALSALTRITPEEIRARANATALRGIPALKRVADAMQALSAETHVPSPALGPGHYAGMLQMMERRRAGHLSQSGGQRSSDVAGGLTPELERLWKSLSPRYPKAFRVTAENQRLHEKEASDWNAFVRVIVARRSGVRAFWKRP